MKLNVEKTALSEKQCFLFAVTDAMPLGVLVLDREGVVFCNKQAERVARRHGLPEEIEVIAGRIFDAIRNSKLEQLFPGEIVFSKRFEQSPSNWIFRMQIILNPRPLVAVFISEESPGSKTDLNKLRIEFKLTRREADIIRRVLNGLSNCDIAEECGITEQTVKDHLSSAYGKLGVKNRLELMQTIMNSSLLR